MTLPKTFIVPINAKRVDILLLEYFPEYTRSFFQKHLKKGNIVCGENTITKNTSVKQGDVLNFERILDEQTKSSLEPCDMSLNIITETSDYLIINKPAGLLTHPVSYQYTEKSLISGLLHLYPKDFSSFSEALRPGIVHRLDKDTSGLLLVAKHEKALSFFQQQFQERTIEKRYFALVVGVPKTSSGVLNAPIGRKLHDTKMGIFEKDAKDAETHFEVIRTYNYKEYTFSLLDVTLVTGRTHQIRVHLHAFGHAILGDPLYGNMYYNDMFPLQRQFLHAHFLKFQDMENQSRSFESVLPEDLEKLLASFS
jgi:23S rRNA pseudouridine1911/1915/1917 synthase